jgi:hypothetical protein
LICVSCAVDQERILQALLRGSPWQRLNFLPEPQWQGELRDCSLPDA